MIQKYTIIVIYLFFFFNSMGEEMKYNNIQFDIKKAESEILPLEFQNLNFGRELKSYFDFYNLNYNGIERYFGYVECNGYKIATAVYHSQGKKQTVLIVHGYLVHQGYLVQFVEELLKNSFNVITFDLPGHGLSTGERAGINDFNDYGKIVNYVLLKYHKEFPDEKLYAVGHSTGCSALYEYMNSFNSVKISRYIFLAPLIRLNHWQLSNFGNKILGNLNSYPRIFRNSSSNKEYLYFQKNVDPIQIRKLPKSWYSSLVKWNRENVSYKVNDEYVTLIQGKKDNIVDYKYNIEFLKKKIQNLRVEILKDGKHDLINEQNSIMEKVYKLVLTELSGE